ncbi:MAG: hypothetical protein ACN6PB_05305, partial [Achromobacter kerstersii]
MSSRPVRAASLARLPSSPVRFLPVRMLPARMLPRTRLSIALHLALPAVVLAAPWPSAVHAQAAGALR